VYTARIGMEGFISLVNILIWHLSHLK
jgi:hypothetical protein